MAKISLKNGTFLLEGYDIAGSTNEFMLDNTVGTEDTTNYGSGGFQELLAVTRAGSWKFATFREDTAEPDKTFFDRMTGDPLRVLSCLTRPAAAGDVAYLGRLLLTNHQFGGNVGTAHRLDLEGPASNVVARGAVIENATNKTASGQTGTHQLAATTGQRMYASLHCLRAAGTSPTLDGSLQRNSVDVADFDQLTTTGQASHIEFDANSSDIYRLDFTIGGTSPDFDFVVAVGLVG